VVFAVEFMTAPVAGRELVSRQPFQATLDGFLGSVVASQLANGFASDVGTAH
jgi:hypothetical protein